MTSAGSACRRCPVTSGRHTSGPGTSTHVSRLAACAVVAAGRRARQSPLQPYRHAAVAGHGPRVGRVGEAEPAGTADLPQDAAVEHQHEDRQGPEDEHVGAPAPDGVEGVAHELRMAHLAVDVPLAAHGPEVGLGRPHQYRHQQQHQDDAGRPRASEPLRPAGREALLYTLMCCSMDYSMKLSICRQGGIVVYTDVLFHGL